MQFIKNYIHSFYKLDTLLAFIISTILFYLYTKNIINSFKFSISFVVVFLFFLNITNLSI